MEKINKDNPKYVKFIRVWEAHGEFIKSNIGKIFKWDDISGQNHTLNPDYWGNWTREFEVSSEREYNRQLDLLSLGVQKGDWIIFSQDGGRMSGSLKLGEPYQLQSLIEDNKHDLDWELKDKQGVIIKMRLKGSGYRYHDYWTKCDSSDFKFKEGDFVMAINDGGNGLSGKEEKPQLCKIVNFEKYNYQASGLLQEDNSVDFIVVEIDDNGKEKSFYRVCSKTAKFRLVDNPIKIIESKEDEIKIGDYFKVIKTGFHCIQTEEGNCFEILRDLRVKDLSNGNKEWSLSIKDIQNYIKQGYIKLTSKTLTDKIEYIKDQWYKRSDWENIMDNPRALLYVKYADSSGGQFYYSERINVSGDIVKGRNSCELNKQIKVTSQEIDDYILSKKVNSGIRGRWYKRNDFKDVLEKYPDALLYTRFDYQHSVHRYYYTEKVLTNGIIVKAKDYSDSNINDQISVTDKEVDDYIESKKPKVEKVELKINPMKYPLGPIKILNDSNFKQGDQGIPERLLKHGSFPMHETDPKAKIVDFYNEFYIVNYINYHDQMMQLGFLEKDLGYSPAVPAYKFQKGDIVIGNSLADKNYGVTGKGCKLTVDDIAGDGEYFDGSILNQGGFFTCLKTSCFDLFKSADEFKYDENPCKEVFMEAYSIKYDDIRPKTVHHQSPIVLKTKKKAIKFTRLP